MFENHIDRLDGLVAALTRVVTAHAASIMELEKRLGRASEDKNDTNLSIEARLAILRKRCL